MNFQRGDLVRWAWTTPPTFEPYWCKSRVAIVLADGRMVDTFWHSLSDTEHCWDVEFQVRPDLADVSFLVNVSDIVPLRGPSEQYADADTFYLCNGGGGSWRWYQRALAVPVPERVLAVLRRRFDDAEHEEQSARRSRGRIREQIAECEAGKAVTL